MTLVTIPPNFGALFAGLGALIVSVVITYGIWLFIKYVRILTEHLSKELLLRDLLLDKSAERRGIDLNKEMRKRELIWTEKKSFDKMLMDEIREDYFQSTKKQK